MAKSFPQAISSSHSSTSKKNRLQLSAKASYNHVAGFFYEIIAKIFGNAQYKSLSLAQTRLFIMFTRLSPYLAMTLLTAGTLSALDAPSLSTSLATDKEHTFNFAFDGDHTTYFSTAEKPREGATLQFDYSESLKGQNITVYSGLPKSGKEKIYNAVLQVSEDNKTWNTIGNFVEGKAEGSINNDAKHVRVLYKDNAWSKNSINRIKIGDHALTRKLITRNVKVGDQEVTIEINVDTEHMDDATELMNYFVEHYFEEWAIISKMLDAPIEKTAKKLYLSFNPDMDYPAFVSGTAMVLNASYIKKRPEDAQGMFTHELSHFVQGYGGSGVPVWFTEGCADYVRFQLHKDSRWALANKKHHTKPIKPLGAYWHSTAFLMWMEKTYDKDIVGPVSRAGSLHIYNDDIWETLTGKTLEQLTKEYQSSK